VALGFIREARAPEVQRRPRYPRGRPRSAQCAVSSSSATLLARHRHLAALLRRDQAVSRSGPVPLAVDSWSLGSKSGETAVQLPRRQRLLVREALRGGDLGFPNPAHTRIQDPLHVFRAKALPFDVPSDERRCQVLTVWLGVPLDPGLSDLARVATVIPARLEPMPRRRRARAASALSGASATLAFGRRPSTSRAPSASCRPFCYGLPGLMRARERRTAIGADRHRFSSRRSAFVTRGENLQTSPVPIDPAGDYSSASTAASSRSSDCAVSAAPEFDDPISMTTFSVLPVNLLSHSL
jgi:hypothetical protein